VKWAQWDKTQPRELLGLFICVCITALHCAQLLHTILHRTDLIIFPLTLQTIIIAPMMSIWGKGEYDLMTNSVKIMQHMTSLISASDSNVANQWLLQSMYVVIRPKVKSTARNVRLWHKLQWLLNAQKYACMRVGARQIQWHYYY